LLDLIEWRKTADNNIEVLNNTMDYYRYYDATKQAEFLFECVDYTINKIIPGEVSYLRSFDEMKSWLDERFQMPDRTTALLIHFLNHNNGKLSKRAREKEFESLTEKEITEIEQQYSSCFRN
jgi:phage regulator Rha-like protein